MARRMMLLAGAITLAATALIAVPTGADAGSGQGARGARGGPPIVKVGAASRSLLPTVGGTHDYLADLETDPDDPYSPGIPIPAWDQGRVAVGNGSSAARWVHDDMEVTAVAFEDLQTKRITVVVAANIYMIFRPDADAIRESVLAELDPATASRIDIAIHADHNHHGPDTAFDVNHEWYDVMIDQVTAAVLEAVDVRRPARLEVAETEHWFGLRDSRDPQVLDPTLGVLRAEATNGDTIATLMFWANHPEVTLFWSPPVTDVLAADCARLGIDPCTAEDSYFTADYPGWATRIVESELGGEAAFINGAIASLITPLGANVWEVTDEHPIGNGLTPPAGAAAPEGASSYTERNFRRAYLIGRELATATLDALDDAEPIRRPTISYDVEPFFTRMSNIGFRFLLVPGDDGLTSLGHVPGELYTCPPTGAKNANTCVPDGFATQPDPLVGTVRVGDHTRSEVAYLRIGPIGTMWLPAEVNPENTVGLPADYDATPAVWHHDDLSLHEVGADYETGGFVKHRMDDEYRWVVGLGNDELGYAVPLDDYRVLCVAGAATCEQLHDLGLIEYPDAVAGATCKAVTEDPALLADYGPAGEAIAASCRYGQAVDEAADHYEETNSVGWDVADDILDAVAVLTGDDDATRLNAALAGWWMGHAP